MLRAVLFDLDDTLFDHRGCARAALTAVHGAHTCFRAIPFEAFAGAHAAHLETLHQEVLAGVRTIDEARIERFRRLFAAAGGDPAAAESAAERYRRSYVAARKAIPGARAVLEQLRVHARIVVVSNNVFSEQQAKIEHCGLAAHIDALVVSETVGVAKPDPRIFEMALRAAGASAHEAVMIGDSWTADIAGAQAAGISPIWFNPHGLPMPDASTGVAELRGFEPVDAAVTVIRRTHASRVHRD